MGRPGRCQKGVQALRASGEEQASRSGADGLGGPLGSIRHQLLRTPGSVRPRMPVCAVGARSSRRSVSGRCGSCFSCTRLCQLGAERGSSSLMSLPCKSLLLGASRLRALWEVSLVFFTDLIATEKSWPGDTVSWTRAPLSSPRAASGVLVPAPANAWVRIPPRPCAGKPAPEYVPHPTPSARRRLRGARSWAPGLAGRVGENVTLLSDPCMVTLEPLERPDLC